MSWQGTHEQHRLLWGALDKLLNEDGIRLGRLAAAINADPQTRETARRWGQLAARGIIDATTLKRWHAGGPDRIASAQAFKKVAVYEFLERSRDFRTEIFNPAPGLPEGLPEFLAAMRGPLSRLRFDRLSNLDGVYSLYRPAWTTPKRRDRVLVSRLEIETVAGLTRYREFQNHTDQARGGMPVQEVDEGVVFNLGSSLILLGFGREEARAKFYAVHAWRPTFDGDLPVHELSGTVMGVVGLGPHRSFDFVAYRSDDPALTSRVLPVTEVDSAIAAQIGCADNERP